MSTFCNDSTRVGRWTIRDGRLEDFASHDWGMETRPRGIAHVRGTFVVCTWNQDTKSDRQLWECDPGSLRPVRRLDLPAGIDHTKDWHLSSWGDTMALHANSDTKSFHFSSGTTWQREVTLVDAPASMRHMVMDSSMLYLGDGDYRSGQVTAHRWAADPPSISDRVWGPKPADMGCFAVLPSGVVVCHEDKSLVAHAGIGAGEGTEGTTTGPS